MESHPARRLLFPEPPLAQLAGDASELLPDRLRQQVLVGYELVLETRLEQGCVRRRTNGSTPEVETKPLVSV
jgi:hypothetical protein